MTIVLVVYENALNSFLFSYHIERLVLKERHNIDDFKAKKDLCSFASFLIEYRSFKNLENLGLIDQIQLKVFIDKSISRMSFLKSVISKFFSDANIQMFHKPQYEGQCNRVGTSISNSLQEDDGQILFRSFDISIQEKIRCIQEHKIFILDQDNNCLGYYEIK